MQGSRQELRSRGVEQQESRTDPYRSKILIEKEKNEKITRVAEYAAGEQSRACRE
jgi:hypothetical protein